MNANPNGVDLILMDIIMPHLDGVSATVCIREVAPTIPIIAMTSNIRADDIDMYFRYGKNTAPAVVSGTDLIRDE
jgi:osomolarity two-component system response regulator SKN7